MGTSKVPNLSASFEITISSDAFYYIFMDEQPLDDEAIAEAEELLNEWPEGLELVEYELIPNDYRVIVKVAPLGLPTYLKNRQNLHYTPTKKLNPGAPTPTKKLGPGDSGPTRKFVGPVPVVHEENDTFKPEQYLYFGPYAVWEIAISNKTVYWRVAKYRDPTWKFGPVDESPLMVNDYGFTYFKAGLEQVGKNAPGTILYLKDFTKY